MKTFRQFFVEKKLGASELKTPERIQAFADKLKNKQPFTLAGGTGEIYLDPSLYNDFVGKTSPEELPKKLRDIDGNIIPWSRLEKTAEFGSRAAPGKVANKGEVAEGILGCGIYARLIKRSNEEVTNNDIFSVVEQLKSSGQLSTKVQDTNSEISDTIIFELKLKPDAMEGFLGLSDAKSLISITGGVLKYVNTTMKRYTDYFKGNNRPDEVRVVADGVSGETDTKVDVYVVHTDVQTGKKRTLRNLDLSVKVGSTKQVGQVGGGAAKLSFEERFDIVKNMFSGFGVDISSIRDQFIRNKDIVKGYGLAYKTAASLLKGELSGNNEENELKFLKQLINTINYYGNLNNKRVKLVQFTDKKGGDFYLLNFNLLDRLYEKDKIDLDVTYKKDSKGKPKITFFNKVDKKPFLSIRTYMASSGYIRNYIEKEKGLVNLISVKDSEKR